MPEQIDPYAGQGGSYEMQPDGTRILLFRTAEECSVVAPMVTETSEEDGDAKPQARLRR